MARNEMAKRATAVHEQTLKLRELLAQIDPAYHPAFLAKMREIMGRTRMKRRRRSIGKRNRQRLASHAGRLRRSVTANRSGLHFLSRYGRLDQLGACSPQSTGELQSAPFKEQFGILSPVLQRH
jgi:hypothetical protein